MIKVSILIVICFLTLNFNAYSQRPDYKVLIEKYRKIFKEEMAIYHDAGLSIALVDGDSIVWCEGFGYYNQKEHKPVTGHTPLHIGSICKVFTGLAVMQLAEKGKINIDAPYLQYVPEFKMKSRFGPIGNITTRQILTHHAGIPDYIKDKFSTKPAYFTSVLDLVNDDYASFPPDLIFSYSNTGFSILGNLIEKVSGQSYFSYMKKNILDPVQMNESGFVIDNKVPESVLLGYDNSGKEHTELAVYDAPAGCIYSTAYDMAKFIKIHLAWGKNNQVSVFDSTTMAQMMKTQNTKVHLDYGSPYGLAWRVYFNDAGRSIQHDGGTLYHRSEIAISPYAGLGVVMLSNSASGKPLLHNDYDLINEALEIKKKYIKLDIPGQRDSFELKHHFKYAASLPNEINFKTLSEKELDDVSGRYGTFGYFVDVKKDTNALGVNIMGQQFYLLPTENDEFIAAGNKNKNSVLPTMRYFFEKYNNSQIMVQIDQWGNQAIIGEKMETIKPDKTWSDRLGNYKTNGINDYQMFSDYSLNFENGMLYLKSKFNMEMPGAANGADVIMPLKIINTNLAVVYGYGRFSGQAIQFIQKDKFKFMGFEGTKIEN